MTTSIIVEDDDVLHALVGVEAAVMRLGEAAAEDLSRSAATEGGAVVTELSAPWSVSGVGPEVAVSPPPDAWWVDFFDLGTEAHGPVAAEHMALDLGGEVIFADFVEGLPASHFKDRAIVKTALTLDATLARLIAEAT